MGFVSKLLFWIGWPAAYLFGRGHRTRVLVIDDTKLLLVKDLISAEDAWGLPGGGLHRNEPILAGAAREVYEETGVKVMSLELLATEPKTSHGLRMTCSYIRANNNERTAKRKSLDVREVRWIALDDLTNVPLRPDVRRALALAGLL